MHIISYQHKYHALYIDTCKRIHTCTYIISYQHKYHVLYIDTCKHIYITSYQTHVIYWTSKAYTHMHIYHIISAYQHYILTKITHAHIIYQTNIMYYILTCKRIHTCTYIISYQHKYDVLYIDTCKRIHTSTYIISYQHKYHVLYRRM